MEATELRRLAGKRGIAVGLLERDQAVTVALGFIAALPGVDSIAFRGDTALAKAYIRGYRFSEDLDFTGPSDVSSRIAGAADHLIAAGNRTGVRFTSIDRRPGGRTGTSLRLRYADYNGHPNSVWVEISHREKVLLPTEPRAILDSYHVLSTDARIPTMALPEILAEKVRALCMRSQARDLFDLGFLVEKGIRPDAELIAAKLSWWRPGVRLDSETVADRINRLEVTWERDLESLVDHLPSFDKVASKVRASLARAMRRR